MSMPPPITENPYPRGPVIQGGSAGQLRKLRDAYYGIYWIIAGTVVTWIIPQAVIEVLVGTDGENANLAVAIIGGALLFMFIVNFVIAFGMAGWWRKPNRDRLGMRLVSPLVLPSLALVVSDSSAAS